MTLSTDILVIDPVPARPLFDHVVGLLASGVDFEPTWRDLTVRPEHARADSSWWKPEHGWCTTLGQGLSAIGEVTYGPDGPLDYCADDWWTDEEKAEAGAWRYHCAKVWFDTGYAYRGPNGGHCTDLHAWLIREVGAWLDDRGARWWWSIDTYSGHHQGPVPVEWGDADRGSLRAATGAS